MFRINDKNKFPKTTGVYKIYFEGQDKFYIGSTYGKRGFYGRWMTHISQLKNNKSKLIKLQLSFNKYFKSDNIIFEILEECSKEECLYREQYYIDLHNCYNNGYNSRKLASNNGGMKMSDNTKDTIRKKWKNLRDCKVNEIISLYKSGKTTREICKTMNISRGYLNRIIKENNIEMRNDRGHRKKKVYQYDNNILINEWESLNMCSRELSFNVRGITCVLNGQCIHYKGYFFSYQKMKPIEIEEIKAQFKLKSKNVKYRNIKQVDKYGNLTNIWNNVNEIIDFLKIKRKTGLYNSIHKNLLYRDFYWQI